MAGKKTPAFFKMLLDTEKSDEMLMHLMSQDPSTLQKMMLDKKVEPHHRAQLLQRLSAANPDLAVGLIEPILAAAGSDENKAIAEKAQKMQEMIEAMQTGPLRYGHFISLIKTLGAVPRAQIKLHDGSTAFSPVPDPKMCKELKVGDGTMLDAQGRAVLYRDPTLPSTGQTARLDRVLEDGSLLVSIDHEPPRVMIAAQKLRDQIKKDEVEPGAMLLVNQQLHLAFFAIPEEDGLSHYRFLDRSPVPASADMGCPPRFIEDYCKHVHTAVTRPAQLDRWKKPRSKCVLLTGVTGTGKTTSIYRLWRRMAEEVADLCGVGVEESPLKVFRLRPAEVLDKWVGSSDRNLNRFNTEVEQYASQPMILADGSETKGTPVLVVIEELDGIARSRHDGDPIHSRILTTLLQNLDQSRPELRGLPIYLVATTNVVSQVDSAAVRRCGGEIVPFGHLNRSSFLSVVAKHLSDLPFAARDGETEPEELCRQASFDLANWIYRRNAMDDGVVEILYANSEPEIKHRRDFMTPALISRAIERATDEELLSEFNGSESAGLTVEQLMKAIDDQIQSTANHLSTGNAHSVIELKEGAHISNIRRLQRSSILPFQLRQAS